ncbi:MAG: DNA recombination protein RmuC [Desulfobulbaceae bacterium]|jgi:DNA recombination protein RmuC|nr:DNA recombination protein RmuC [Desulfobulbaceae bacterium]HKJ15020.1 DNA recombination protein RmuC [Desulfobulbales bacterium]MDH3775731.1 DNA recombination protein RmuC [Desulfobulbaceae bacterium]MDH3782592.1 DNA recombination protein RmuC [Desulfobulbaceae bacterium]MDH3866990.1 DNA recombination protein RmuC [Desulfobulbaceae bacterium]
MNDAGMILAVMAGVLVGIGGALLLLAGKNRQIAELMGEIKGREEDVAAQRERLAGEAERRAVAEEKSSRVPGLEEGLEQAKQENGVLLAKLSELETRLEDERRNAAEKIVLLQEAREQLKMEFQNVANKIFEDKSQKFTEQNRENIEGVLKPMREQLLDFKKKVEDVYDKESKDRVSLLNEIIHLKTLNERISEDAVNLTNALKGQSKTRGAWGEMILERVLEESGLQKGREYEVQTMYAGEEGQRRHPDVIVHLPEGKDIVIDSKVSLTAYEKYCTAGTDEKREKRLKEHIISVRTHIKALSEKRYEELEGIRTLDFVLMFMPIEGAFWTAIESEQGLFNEAFNKNIMLVSPSTLLATLRIINNIWRYEDQNKNALIIAKKAGDLFDKFVGFVEVLDDVGQKIDKARESYQTARKRLIEGRGNLVRRTTELRQLGVKAQKELPEGLVVQALEEE